MHEYPTPAELHQRVLALWPADSEWDARSSLLRSIEAAVVTGVAELRPSGGRRAANWITTLHRHEQFWRDQERSPREKTRNASTLPDEERWLGEWSRYQRRSTLLVRYQVIRLDVSPSFSWDPQQSAWIANYEACSRHKRMNGSLPRLTSADRDQFVLARWLDRQLGQLRAGALPHRRARLLRELLADRSQTQIRER